MATIARMNVALAMDSKDFEAGVKSAAASGESLASKLGKIGQGMTAGVTLPLVGAAAAAIKFSTDLNSSMANVASLGVASERVAELKDNIQEMAVVTGKSTSDLSGGLYQVISAFGDTADTASILETNAKAAAAGLATTSEAIALTSAVTKGYGDTSAAAVTQAADLALQTVALGQTTFPELAASIGSVTPLAASLGVAQEELFAVMATGTGVTGNASAVSTQLRGVLQSLMAPTENMIALQESMGFSSGDAMLQQLGLQGTIEAVTAAAAKSGAPLQSYIGSIEGQTLALALAGPQAEAYKQKLAAMGQAAGATDKAFAAQTQGINAGGFAMQQLQIRGEVLMQKLGDGLAPALNAVLTAVSPLADGVLAMAGQFANADAGTQTMIVGVLALVAALGPLLTMMPAIGAAIGVLTGPIGLVVVAVAALAMAWQTNFGGIQDITQGLLSTVQPIFQGIYDVLILGVEPLGDWSYWWEQMSLTVGPAAAAVVSDVTKIASGVKDMTTALVTGDWSSFNVNLAQLSIDFGTLIEDMGLVSPAVQGVLSGFQGVGGAIVSALPSIQGVAAAMLDAGINSTEASEAITALPTALQPVATGFQSLVATVTTAATMLQMFLAPAFGRLQEAVGGVGPSLATLGPSFQALGDVFSSFWAAAQPILTALAQAVGAGLAIAMDAGINLMGSVFANLPSLIEPIISQVTASIELVGTTLKGMTDLVVALINGDWAGAFTAAQSIVDGFESYFSSTLDNITAAATAVFTVLSETITQTLTDMGVNVESLLDGLQATWTSIWEGMGQAIQPVLDAVAGLKKGIEDFVGWISGISIPNPFAGIQMPSMPSLPSLPGFANGGAVTAGVPIMVGERGEEMFVPNVNGRIIPHDELGGWMADAVAPTSGPGVSIGQVAVYNEIDIRALAYQVAQYLARRR